MVAVFLVWPGLLTKLGVKEPKLKKGLDLVGGTYILYEADLSKVDPKDTASAIDSLVANIDRRVNSLGVAEPQIRSVKIGKKSGVIVELPGIKDIDKAMKVIGKTAKLEFKKEGKKAGEWEETGLTGKNLKKAQTTVDSAGNPAVSISFDKEGTKLFSDLTKQIGKRIAIFLDDELISAPVVQAHITDGNAIIQGKFTIEEAKNLAIQLNAGALPVPIKPIEQKVVEASLGKTTVEKSLVAGIVGLVMIALFMIFYYKLAGLVAIMALLLYGLFVLAIFRLSGYSPSGITLTLSGVAGFILSIGMAVDANILIFERTKEELAQGRGCLLYTSPSPRD